MGYWTIKSAWQGLLFTMLTWMFTWEQWNFRSFTQLTHFLCISTISSESTYLQQQTKNLYFKNRVLLYIKSKLERRFKPSALLFISFYCSSIRFVLNIKFSFGRRRTVRRRPVVKWLAPRHIETFFSRLENTFRQRQNALICTTSSTPRNRAFFLKS